MPQMTLSGTAFVTGWGRCDFTGNELCLPRTSQYYPDEKIDPMLRSVPLTINSQNHYCEGYKLHGTDIGKGMLCAGGAREENSAYPCLAVPGAPLVLGAKLVGILSWGFGCGFQHDLPLIYTSTQYYTSWITHNIVMFRTLSNNDFTQLFQATKSCVLLDWLSRTRISMPLSHDHSNVYKELQLMKFDEKLVMLQGRPYDIRDYIYETEFHNKKILLYEEVKKTLEEKLSKAEIIKNASKLLLLHKVMPFLSNKSLLGVTYEDNDNSDDD
ncbi:uncharacterized protein LOC123880535 isoform X4 [Maniola jurtina]|nr:uncharacterized protein LOC123880535 isoform X4 [Maniola jurtina]